MWSLFQAHKLGVFIARYRGINPRPLVTDDFGRLVKVDYESFRVSAYGWRDQH